jgi:hypothetical protein
VYTSRSLLTVISQVFSAQVSLKHLGTLWTGVVVALFVEIIPRAKQRQITQALDAYEAALREKEARSD